MSAKDRDDPESLLARVGRICQERGATVPVSPAYYKWFATLDDEEMTELIRLAVLDRADDINNLVFHKRGSEDDLFRMVGT